jgi:translation initiation factor IF-3
MARQSSGSGQYRGKGKYQGKTYIRKNERIRAREVRLIGPDSKQIGVLPTNEALHMAKTHGLDLVEVSASAKPPVCRILDFGKYKYELSKKSKDSKQQSAKIKEVKLRVRIEQHDYMTKLRHAEDFLYKGHKLKISLIFRGRENEHKELGFEIVKRALNDLLHVGHKDSDPKLAGRNVLVTLSPLPANKRALKYNEAHEES